MCGPTFLHYKTNNNNKNQIKDMAPPSGLGATTTIKKITTPVYHVVIFVVLDKSPAHGRAHSDKQPFIPRANLESPINLLGA